MPRRLIIIGRGPTAERLAELGGQLGYEELRLVAELPDDISPDDHVVVGEDDPAVGRELLLSAAQGVLPAYLAYAGPQRDGWKALVRLAAAKLPKARLDAVAAPAGVDVGAETPEEVAIAVAAELVAIRRGRPRPSAGLPVESKPSRAHAAGARPRRLLGRPAPPAPESDGEGEKN